MQTYTNHKIVRLVTQSENHSKMEKAERNAKQKFIRPHVSNLFGLDQRRNVSMEFWQKKKNSFLPFIKVHKIGFSTVTPMSVCKAKNGSEFDYRKIYKL